jgi:hypothetical protein
LFSCFYVGHSFAVSQYKVHPGHAERTTKPIQHM